MKRQIEIFTAGCPVCEPLVQMVNEMTCDNYEVTTYDVVKQREDKICLSKLSEYGVKKLPAVAVNGKLLDCCQNNAVTKENLVAAGIGKQ